jgi:RNA 2',3'-cyclic 3'-phosphodiesterase
LTERLDRAALAQVERQPVRRFDQRLFFAVYPDAAACHAIARIDAGLRAEHGLLGRSLAGRLHVTLHFLGDYESGDDEEVASRAQRAGQIVAARPFAARFNHVVSLPRPRRSPVFLRGGDNALFVEFQQALAVAMIEAGLGDRVNLRFDPQITLLYDDRTIAEKSVTPVEWAVREFFLVRSVLGEGRHIIVARWPLVG